MFRAKSTFFIPGHRVVAGDLVADDDPIVQGREALFEQVDVPKPNKPAAPNAPVRKATPKKSAG